MKRRNFLEWLKAPFKKNVRDEPPQCIYAPPWMLMGMTEEEWLEQQSNDKLTDTHDDKEENDEQT